jgi:hypothetical protein
MRRHLQIQAKRLKLRVVILLSGYSSARSDRILTAKKSKPDKRKPTHFGQMNFARAFELVFNPGINQFAGCAAVGRLLLRVKAL